MSVKKSILEMARGAIQERVDYEMGKVMDNILDVNTNPTAKRKLTLTIVFTPDAERSSIAVDVTAKSTLQATNPVRTSLYIAGESSTGEVQAVEMVPEIPGQLSMDGESQESPSILSIANYR